MRYSTYFAAVATLIPCVAAYPFMANYHNMDEAAKRDLQDLARRSAVAYCKSLRPWPLSVLYLTSSSFQVPLHRSQDRRSTR